MYQVCWEVPTWPQASMKCLWKNARIIKSYSPWWKHCAKTSVPCFFCRLLWFIQFSSVQFSVIYIPTDHNNSCLKSLGCWLFQEKVRKASTSTICCHHCGERTEFKILLCYCSISDESQKVTSIKIKNFWSSIQDTTTITSTEMKACYFNICRRSWLKTTNAKQTLY